jgi:hypothetical protein
MKAKSLRCNCTRFWSISIKLVLLYVLCNFLFQLCRISWFLWLNLFSTLSPSCLNHFFDVSLLLSWLFWVNDDWIVIVSKSYSKTEWSPSSNHSNWLIEGHWPLNLCVSKQLLQEFSFESSNWFKFLKFIAETRANTAIVHRNITIDQANCID